MTQMHPFSLQVKKGHTIPSLSPDHLALKCLVLAGFRERFECNCIMNVVSSTIKLNPLHQPYNFSPIWLLKIQGHFKQDLYNKPTWGILN